MKLVVFGATGGAGAQVVDQAVTAGHRVTVVARNPTAVTAADIRVVPGDVLVPDGWQEAIAGQDAVVSCLGSTHRKVPTTVYSEGTANILDAMRAAGVRRILCLSSGGVDPSPETPLMQRLVIRFVIQRMYRYAYADMLEMERTLRHSDAAWTVVRAPMLTDGPPHHPSPDGTGLPRT